MSTAGKKKAEALTISFLYLAVVGVGLSRTPYANAAGLILVALHLSWMTVLSILVVRDRILGRPDRNSFLRRWRHWISDFY